MEEKIIEDFKKDEYRLNNRSNIYTSLEQAKEQYHLTEFDCKMIKHKLMDVAIAQKPLRERVGNRLIKPENYCYGAKNLEEFIELYHNDFDTLKKQLDSDSPDITKRIEERITQIINTIVDRLDYRDKQITFKDITALVTIYEKYAPQAAYLSDLKKITATGTA